MLPTLLVAVGEPDIKEKLLAGHAVMGRDYTVHLDGYNLLPYFEGEAESGPRKEFLYWTDGGDLAALRYNQWKLHFLEQRVHGFDHGPGVVRAGRGNLDRSINGFPA